MVQKLWKIYLTPQLSEVAREVVAEVVENLVGKAPEWKISEDLIIYNSVLRYISQ